MDKPEKENILLNLVLGNTLLLPKVLESQTPDNQVEFVTLLVNELSREDGQNNDRRIEVLNIVSEKYPSLLMKLIKDNPHFIRFVKYQSEELCELALNSLIEQDSFNCVVYFKHLKHQSYDMVKRAVSADSRCYQYVKEGLRTQELANLAVRSNATVLRHIEPRFHTEELLTMAVTSWAKSIRWVKCEDENLRKSMILLAMRTNLQSIPAPSELFLTADLREAYKKLCIEANYFPENWGIHLDFSQEQLYTMLQVRKQWIESYLIFDLLDKEHKIKALKEGLMLYNLNHLVLQDLLDMESDETALGILLTLAPKDLKVKYFNHLKESNDTEGKDRIKKLIGQDAKLLRSIGSITFLLDDQEFLDDILEIVTN